MVNSVFNCKQFSIQQNNNAFKVGTDAMLLGAWANIETASHILDIGCGTGIITLMCAQRNLEATLLGLELNLKASELAQLNVQNSKWCDRISICNDDIIEFSVQSPQHFDAIVCNPPFFSNSTKSKEAVLQLARHSDSLNYTQLLKCAVKLLVNKGQLSVIIPATDMDAFVDKAYNNELQLKKRCIVFPLKNRLPERLLLNFEKSSDKREKEIIETELVIQRDKQRNNFTDEYIQLTKAFHTIL